MPWAKRATKRIPSISSRTQTVDIEDYSRGFNSYISNDKFPIRNGEANMWRLAMNARIPTLGEYETRKGVDMHSVNVGETIDTSITATTGQADKSFNETTWLAEKRTAVGSGRLCRIDIRLKNDEAATGTPLIEIWSDASGVPGTFLSRSSIASSTITDSYTYLTVYYAEPPSSTASSIYWTVARVQTTGSGSYKWASTTATSTALVSTNSGSTWSAGDYSLNYKAYITTDSPVKGFIRAYKSDGTKITIFAHGTSVYSVDNVTGALTTIKTGLSASATFYDFKLVNDTIYYCNGYDGLRKLSGATFSTDAQVNTTNYSQLIIHKGLLFGVRFDDKTRIDFSNFGEYEVFTSTDFLYVPAPNTGDDIASVLSLNGYLLIRTQNRCYILSGDDNATFRIDDAPDQKGTYSPLTSCSDKSYNYFLSDDGVYKSNGTQPQLMSESIHEDIRGLANKEDCCMVVNKGRLYLWFKSAGSAVNDSCYVWNLNYSGDKDTVESLDTKSHVSMAVSGFQDNDDLLVASSLTGQIMWQELESNDYTNMGGDIDFELRTHYMSFGSAANLHEIRYWKPRFGTDSSNHTVTAQYAYDLRDNAQDARNVNVQGTGSIWGASSTIWGSFTWGTTKEVQADLYVPGEHRRTQLRYKHYATRQPVRFLGHSLVVQLRRMK